MKKASIYFFIFLVILSHQVVAAPMLCIPQNHLTGHGPCIIWCTVQKCVGHLCVGVFCNCLGCIPPEPPANNNNDASSQ